MANLVLKEVNKVYHSGYHAVQDLNMEIKDGEFVCLVGNSGCGKSAILKMIAGLEDITSGEFYIDGKLANKISPRDRGIAMVFQSYALYPNLTVAENLGFGLMLEGVAMDDIDKKVEATAKLLGLDDCLERFPRNLSEWQRKRIAVGRALIRGVKIFLMDEPLINLTEKQRAEAVAEIKRVHRAVGATTIYATRNTAEAEALADRIVFFEGGENEEDESQETVDNDAQKC